MPLPSAGAAPRPPGEALGTPRCVVAWAFVLAAAWYLGWRIATLNPHLPGVSALVLAAEVFVLARVGLQFALVRRLAVRSSRPAPPGLTVDVFVTAQHEPFAAIRRTLLAAREIDYPHRTWLLDDADRAELRALAADLGVRYIARAEPARGRGGALNNALRFSTAAFIAIFEAGHAPARRFLAETLGYFADDEVGFVQAALAFHNLDSPSHRRDPLRRLAWTERALYFRVLQRGRDWHGAAQLCASGATIRRSALNAAGGFATGTAGEALHTSLKLHKRGFRSVYHARPLAYGIAPAGIESLLREHVRGVLGAMQVWRRERILSSRRLDRGQKLCYFATWLGALDGWAKAVLYVAPVVVLVKGAAPFAASMAEFALHAVPCYLLAAWTLEELGRGYAPTLVRAQYGMARFAASMWATSGLFRPRARLRAVAAPEEPRQVERFLAPQSFVLGANVAAIALGGWLYATGSSYDPAALGIGAAWAAAVAALAASAIGLARLPYGLRRHDHRFAVPIPARLRFPRDGPVLGIFDDVSAAGFRFYGAIPQERGAGTAVTGDLFLPGGPLPFDAVIRSEVRDRPGGPPKCIRCSFEWRDESARDRLEAFLHGSELQFDLNGLAEQRLTPLEQLARLTGEEPVNERIDAAHWAPVLYHAAAPELRGPEVAFVSVPEDEGAERTLVTMRPLDPHALLRFRVVTRVGSRPLAGTPVPIGDLETPTAPVYLYLLAD